jgi:UDP-2,3-diacylglucosamine hydrolase
VKQETLFISDLHLSPDDPATTCLFLEFLSRRAAGAAALYILGDLFDTWIGDDDDPLPEVREGLRTLTAAGTTCALMHGNRDFLLGQRFARATGCRLLRDGRRIQLGGEPVLLMHGDLLCTDDVAYLRFRRKVRNPLVQALFLLKPLAERRRVAADYRAKSTRAMAAKTTEIMDANPHAVLRRMQRAGVRRMVHGHTHRPADHELLVAGRPAVRHVLTDWHADRGEVLVHDRDGWHREPVTAG